MISCSKYAQFGNVGNPDFDWDLYADGWNGVSLKVNSRIKAPNGLKVYCHEDYAEELLEKYSGVKVDALAKDVRKGTSVAITDVNVLNDDTLVATIGGGANSILVDLNKDNRLISTIRYNDKTFTNSKEFTHAIKTDEDFKKTFLANNFTVKIGTDLERGSIWDGYIDKLTEDFKEQIIKGNNAYWAEVLATNGGGFVVEVAGAIKAFMPGSMAAKNKIDDYESYIGKVMEVMIESWNPKYGFVVSRKKFINKVAPFKMQPIEETLKKAPETVYKGKITGANQFGVYVELDEFITGMIHKTLASDTLRDAMRKNAAEGGVIVPGTEIEVYAHKIENGRLILSDVAPKERKAVIARREAEDNAEKSEHLAQKRSQQQTTA